MAALAGCGVLVNRDLMISFMDTVNGIFSRMELLVGGGVMRRVERASVIVFGVGGVGSWCAEGLVRSGVRRLTIVDSDSVCMSNVNRQLMATTKTVGRVKVEALRERLLEISPGAEITAVHGAYTADTAGRFRLGDFDYVVDAIDSVVDKALLILNACRSGAVLFSSMGAALKIDPARIQVAEFWRVKGCPLAAALRRRFRRSGEMPAKRFKCVFSDELLSNMGGAEACGGDGGLTLAEPGGSVAASAEAGPNAGRKARVNGSAVHITAIYGFTLAGLVIGDIRGRG